MPSYEFNLNVDPGGMPPVIHLAQYDTARTYYANLKQDGQAYYTGLGTTAKIKGKNNAGVCWEQSCTIDSSHLDQVVFTPSGAATDQFGIMPVQMELTDTNGVISTLLMVWDIQKAGYTNEDAVVSPEFAEAMEAAAAQAVGDAVVWRANQATKTEAMTQPVGIDSDGALFVEPGGGGGAGNAVLYVSQSLTSSQKTQARTNIGAGTYSKPSGGIPTGDMAFYETEITESSGSYTSEHTLSQVLGAYNSDKQLRFYLGVFEIQIDEIDSTYIAMHYIDTTNPNKPKLVSLVLSDSGVAGTTYELGNAFDPTETTVTGNTPSISSPGNNTIYNCTGSGITSLTVSNYSYGTAFTVKFNTQPDLSLPTITLDSKIQLPVNFSFAVNRHYEINVDVDGYAAVGEWELVD